MAISSTTFEERINRIQKEAAKADRARRRPRKRPGGLVALVSVGMVIGGAAFAWDGSTPPYEWALPGVEWALSLIR